MKVEVLSRQLDNATPRALLSAFFVSFRVIESCGDLLGQFQGIRSRSRERTCATIAVVSRGDLAIWPKTLETIAGAALLVNARRG